VIVRQQCLSNSQGRIKDILVGETCGRIDTVNEHLWLMFAQDADEVTLFVRRIKIIEKIGQQRLAALCILKQRGARFVSQFRPPKDVPPLGDKLTAVSGDVLTVLF